MGLSLSVGILADLRGHDPEGAAAFRGHFEELNNFLASVGMEPHREPEACEVWSADMYGYSGLHYLRRLAAHLDSADARPGPGGEDSSEDPLVEAYFANVTNGSAARLLRRLWRPRRFARTFDHLIVHGDAEGFYLPGDFPKPLIVPDDWEVPGSVVGSAPRLLVELARLAGALAIPEGLHAQSAELWEAADSQGEGDQLWQRYGIESYSCVVLTEGCRKALAARAALVFT